ncbi:MAG TPA: hypothetical protein PL029_08870 [Bacteroidia bacterium]|nr:hypothetical protein [Bacteroidia bacterium]
MNNNLSPTVILLVLIFTSCKKDYTCECNYYGYGGGTVVKVTVEVHDTKKKAKKGCEQNYDTNSPVCILK